MPIKSQFKKKKTTKFTKPGKIHKAVKNPKGNLQRGLTRTANFMKIMKIVNFVMCYSRQSWYPELFLGHPRLLLGSCYPTALNCGMGLNFHITAPPIWFYCPTHDEFQEFLSPVWRMILGAAFGMCHSSQYSQILGIQCWEWVGQWNKVDGALIQKLGSFHSLMIS